MSRLEEEAEGAPENI